MSDHILRKIPSVNELIESPEISRLCSRYPRQLIVEIIRKLLKDIRQSLIDGESTRSACDFSPQRLSQLIQQEIQNRLQGVEYAINATGIIIHTGLGRAPLADEVLCHLQNTVKGSCTLEIEKFTGKRGFRYRNIEEIICLITGAESALVVNNNAAAVLLALDTIAKGKDVIISRSQLVEIGGSFRMPDIMNKSGVTLVEVGTTNKTYITDYSNAITDRTAMILKVHQSNFKIIGFTEDVDLEDLVRLGHSQNIPIMYDLGSGALINPQTFGLPREPTVQESIKAGVDVVTFSTDKLLGGPQGGILAGKKIWIDRMKSNPLARALRVGKLTIAALEATLNLYLRPDEVTEKIPVLKMLTTPAEVIKERCKRVIENISPATRAALCTSIVEGVSEAGGGSLPGEGIKTHLISLHSDKLNAGELAAQFRNNTPPIFTRIEQNQVLLDMRTVYDGKEINIIIDALESIASLCA